MREIVLIIWAIVAVALFVFGVSGMRMVTHDRRLAAIFFWAVGWPVTVPLSILWPKGGYDH